MLYADKIVDHRKSKINQNIGNQQIGKKSECRQIEHRMIPTEPVKNIHSRSSNVRKAIFINKPS